MQKENEHFNNLDPVTHEMLSKLFEECAEVIQVVGKIMVHGLDSDSLGKYATSNRVELQKEIADVFLTIELLRDRTIISQSVLGTMRKQKLELLREKCAERFHHITRDMLPLR